MLSEDERDDLIADNNFQHGRDYERERIVALLEKLTWTRNCLYTETIDCSICRINVHEAIAHIKGENE